MIDKKEVSRLTYLSVLIYACPFFTHSTTMFHKIRISLFRGICRQETSVGVYQLIKSIFPVDDQRLL